MRPRSFANQWLQVSALLLSASILWLLRCAFVLASDLDSIAPYWSENALSVLKFVYPVLDYWVAATVLGLVTFLLRKPVWSDPAVMGPRRPEQQPQVVTDPGYPHPQYGYQHPAEMYQPPAPTGMYQHYPAYQQYPQQGMYPLPPELSPTPAPATRVYEAGGAQRAAELQSGWAPHGMHRA